MDIINKNSFNPQELNRIVASLLIVGRYEEYELFMKEVFCAYLLNNKMYLGWLLNNLSADLIFKIICSLAQNGAVSQISPYMIIDCKVNDKNKLRELLQKVYYDKSTITSSKSIRLTILMAEKYGVDNLAELLETTDEAINERIRPLLKNRHPSEISETQMLYLCFMEFRKPFDHLNEQELKLLNHYENKYFYPERILNIERKLTQSILSGDFSQNILGLNINNSDELLLKQSSSEPESEYDNEYMSILQDEKKITSLMKQYNAEYNASWDFRKAVQPKDDTNTYLQALNIIFKSYQNVHKIIQVLFSLLYSFPLETRIRYLYEANGKYNDYLRYLLKSIVLSGSVMSSSKRCIYVFPISFYSVNKFLPVTGCNGKVRSGSEDVVPKRNERIYFKIHSYDPIKNTVLFRCPAYTEEECKNYKARRRNDKMNGK
ncbi:hypothetical protein [uncultured Ruminococcus sp.]|uniref:hypothetical protein n=1 Tax=uncultured Ruminococcus sp. TaxID=165186 RepID=UPI0026314424|nr:hypothetical protein [uncultured Ruminococcus sp.]